jgi:hypothetical protein
VTKRDASPMPRIDDPLDQLGGCQFKSTMDMTTGYYYHILVKEEDKEKTAFITKRGLFEYNGLPMGLMNAPATFQRDYGLSACRIELGHLFGLH